MITGIFSFLCLLVAVYIGYELHKIDKELHHLEELAKLRRQKR